MRFRIISGFGWAVGVCFLVTLGTRAQDRKPFAAEPSTPATGARVPEGAQAGVPRLVKFSGVLRDLTGKPLSGPVKVSFLLYKDEARGEPLWFETQMVEADAQGRYTVLLGAMHAAGLPIGLFTSGEARWLGVQVGNLPEQSRVLLVSVAYALKAADAETLGGRPAAAFVLSDTQGAGTSATAGKGATSAATVPSTARGRIHCPQVTSNGTATANSISKFTTPCNIQDSVITEVNGFVGIATKAPTARVHVRTPFGQPSNIFLEQTGASLLKLAGEASGVVGTANNFPLDILTNNFSRIRIDSTGNVGIGTPAPVAKLHVVGNINATGSVTAASFSGGITTTSLNCTGCVGNTQLGVFYAGSASKGGPATSALTATAATTAATATNALALGGVAAANYARLDIPNTFMANQSVTGDLSVSGLVRLPATTGATTGVIRLGGASFAHSFGQSNTFLGPNAGNFTITGQNNTATGASALNSDTTGNNNIAIGASALALNTQGNGNTAIGTSVLFNNTTGSGNTALGVLAGQSATQANANKTGSNNTFIGFQSGPGTPTQLTNATAIGANAVVSANNSMVLGDGTVNVGIGTPTPVAKLDVVGNINATGSVTAASFSGGVTTTSLTCTGCVGNTQLGVSYAGSASKGGPATSALTATTATAAATSTNSLALGGVAASGYAPASGSPNYVKSNGLARLGSETGTSEPPTLNVLPYQGVVTRRINSATTTAGSVVAATAVLQLQRDGTDGGFQITTQFGGATIACMGVDASGNTVNRVITNLNTGTTSVYSNAQNLIYFNCSFFTLVLFGTTHHTVVQLQRGGATGFAIDNRLWVGFVTSTFNQ